MTTATTTATAPTLAATRRAVYAAEMAIRQVIRRERTAGNPRVLARAYLDARHALYQAARVTMPAVRAAYIAEIEIALTEFWLAAEPPATAPTAD